MIPARLVVVDRAIKGVWRGDGGESGVRVNPEIRISVWLTVLKTSPKDAKPTNSIAPDLPSPRVDRGIQKSGAPHIW